jgi:hypothetical protein
MAMSVSGLDRKRRQTTRRMQHVQLKKAYRGGGKPSRP